MKINDTDSKLELLGIPSERIKQTVALSIVATVFIIYNFFALESDSRNSMSLYPLVLVAFFILRDIIALKYFRIEVEPRQFSIRGLIWKKISSGTPVKANFYFQKFRKNSGSIPTVMFQQDAKFTRVVFETSQVAENFLKRAKDIYPQLEIEDRRSQASQ